MIKTTLKVLALMAFLSVPALAVEVGQQAPCLNVDQLKVDGSRSNHSLCDRNSGTQFLLLDFFQTGCGACVANLPNVARLSGETQKTTTFRLVALDRNEELVAGFVAQHQDLIKYEVPLDSQRLVTKAYGIQVTPTTVVVDKDGKVVYVHTDLWTDADYEHLRSLLLGH